MRVLRFLVLAIATIGLCVGIFGGAMVAAAAANLSHSYKSASSISAGSLVSLDPQHSGYIIATNSQNSQTLLGVAVSNNDSLLAVNTTSGNVQVALSGMANTLVSTLNGSISIGDQIAVSPLNGVGMKSTPGAKLIGIAQAAFNSNSSGANNRQVKDKSGKTQNIAVGYIPLVIAISTAPNLKTTSGSSINILQRFAGNVSGHSVSSLAVITSTIIAFVAMISIITLVYGTIRGSMISIGRNPLARSAIFESLAQVIGMAILIVVIAVVIIYFVLR